MLSIPQAILSSHLKSDSESFEAADFGRCRILNLYKKNKEVVSKNSDQNRMFLQLALANNTLEVAQSKTTTVHHGI